MIIVIINLGTIESSNGKKLFVELHTENYDDLSNFTGLFNMLWLKRQVGLNVNFAGHMYVKA